MCSRCVVIDLAISCFMGSGRACVEIVPAILTSIASDAGGIAISAFARQMAAWRYMY